jgi:tRNA threonylcarbamoyladenosine biosynthesis protein TsaE
LENLAIRSAASFCHMKKNIRTRSAVGTKKIGKDMARSLTQGCVIALEGNLGAGKTVLTKGIAEGLGIVHTIQSPTYVLMKVYPVKRPGISHLVHVDCYRVAKAFELSDIGLEDYLNDDTAVVVIEWADKIRDMLPRQRITLKIASQGEKNRTVLIRDSRSFSRKSKPHTGQSRPR